MLQVPKLRHRELGEMETEKESLHPSIHGAPSRAPDNLWEFKGSCEETVLGQQILADHSDSLRVLRGEGVGGSGPRPSAHDRTSVSGIHPPIRRGHLDVHSEYPGHRIHLVVHNKHPVLNWKEREDP